MIYWAVELQITNYNFSILSRRDGPCGRPLKFRQEFQIFPATQGKYWLRQCDFVPKSPDARKGRPYASIGNYHTQKPVVPPRALPGGNDRLFLFVALYQLKAIKCHIFCAFLQIARNCKKVLYNFSLLKYNTAINQPNRKI